MTSRQQVELLVALDVDVDQTVGRRGSQRRARQAVDEYRPAVPDVDGHSAGAFEQ